MSADEVTRYDPQLHGTDHRVHIVMEPDDTGDYVLHWDYETLAARLSAVEAQRQSLHTENLRLIRKDQEGAKEVARLRAVEAERDRLRAKVVALREDRERLEAVRLAALREIAYDAEPASEKYVTGTIQMAHSILATGQPEGILKTAALSPTEPKEPNR